MLSTKQTLRYTFWDLPLNFGCKFEGIEIMVDSWNKLKIVLRIIHRICQGKSP